MPTVSPSESNSLELGKKIRQAYISAINALFPESSLAIDGDWSRILRTLRKVRPHWSLPEKIAETDAGYENELANLGSLIWQEIEQRKKADNVKPKRGRKKTPSEQLAQQGLIRVAADRINKAAIEAFMPGAMRTAPEIMPELDRLEARGLVEGKLFWAAYLIETKRDDLFGAMGFTEEPNEAIWMSLQKNGALAVKAQYALWARAYAET
ncbi:MAG: hypothetical protein H7Z37_16955, partial [Pyrinomonadaceae bacterium]|nr:hypothetical protein [Pyrinomonadaceae bacterium]